MDILIIIGLPLALLGLIGTFFFARRRRAYYTDFHRRRVNIVINADDQASMALRRAADSMADIRVRIPNVAR